MSLLNEEQKDIEFIRSLAIMDPQPKSAKEEEFLREVCEYEFVNMKEHNVALKFTYGTTKRHTNFTFFPGGKYPLPRFIARWVESRGTPTYDWRPNGEGQLIKKYISHSPRFQMRQVFSQ